MTAMQATPTPTESAAPARRPWAGGWRSAYATARGLRHAANEDCCLHAPSADAPAFCAVADGVGGGAFGEVASHALARHCAAAPPEIRRDPARLAAWVKQGDAVVREAIARRGDRPGASTLAAAWLFPWGRVWLSHIGDCRAYRLRRRWRGQGWHIERLTVDQTYANLGRTPPPGGSPDDPARMAGVGAAGEPPVRRVWLWPGDLLLLCSDGLHKFVDDTALAELVGEGLRQGLDLRELCGRLVDAALAGGSQDDVSALLVRRRPWPPALPIFGKPE